METSCSLDPSIPEQSTVYLLANFCTTYTPNVQQSTWLTTAIGGAPSHGLYTVFWWLAEVLPAFGLEFVPSCSGYWTHDVVELLAALRTGFLCHLCQNAFVLTCESDEGCLNAL